MKTIFTFLLLVSCSAILSAQCNFQRLMDDGRQYFQHGKYDRAIQKYNAARTCNPSQSAAVDKAVDQVFQEIQKQKDREKAAKIDAERQKEEAEKQRKEAVRLGKLADTKAEQANKADSIARKQGLTSKLNAFSNDIKEYDLTFAIQLAQKGCILSNNSDELSVKIRRSIWEKKSNQFYSAVLDGHEGSLSTVKYSSKGRYIATGSFDQYVFLWNNEGAYEDRFWEFESPVMAVAFSPDERFLAVGLFNGQTIIISLISFKQQYILQGQHIGAVTSVAFSPDGSLLLTGGDDKKAFLWDTLGQVRNSLIGHRNVVYGVAFSPDGQTLLTASLDNNLRLWNLRGEQIGQPIKGHANCVFAATFSPNGAYILSGSRDKTVKLWDKTGKLIRTFLGHEGEVTSVAFSPDNRQILSGSRDGTARLWQIYGNESRLLQGHQGQILAVDFAPDGQHFITAGEDRAAKIWDMQTRWIDVQPGHTAAVTGAVFMPDGRHLLTGSKDHSAILWDSIGKPEIRYNGHESDIYAVAVSPNGRVIATGSRDNTAKIWNTRGFELATITGHESDIKCLAFSPDSRHLLTGSIDFTAKLWDLNGHEEHKFVGHTAEIQSVACAPNGQYVLSGAADSTARLWNIQTETVLWQSPKFETWVIAVGFTRAGSRFMVAGADGNVQIWADKADKTAGWDLAAQIDAKTITAAALSPDGTKIATGNVWSGRRWGGAEYSVVVWSLDGTKLQEFRGQKDLINSVEWSTDGSQLLIGSEDGTASIRILATGKNHTFKGHNSQVRTVRMFPDGKSVLTIGGDQAVIGWGITGDQIFRREFDETDQVVCADIARSGNFFATGTALGSIGIWNRAGEPIMKWPTDSLVLSVAIAPKENLLAAAIGESSLLLWPLTRDSKPQIIASESTLYCVAFTPSGDTVAVCNSRGEVLLYSVRGELLNKFLADSLGNMLFTIGVSPDGRYLATGGVRDTAWVYDFSGKRIQTMTGHQGSITYITFSPDGKYILTGSSKLWRNSEGDNTMKLWDVNAANLQHYPLQSTSGGYGVAFSPTGDTLLTGTERYFALYHHLERYLNAAHLAKITGKMQQTIGIDLADFEDEAIKNQKAMEQQIAIVDFTEQEFSKNPSDDGTRVRLASAYGSLAWFYLFVNKPEKSIDAAKKALQLDSSQTWVNTNLALGYLFVDQWDEAEKIYRRLYKDDWQKSGFGSSKLKTFLEAFEDDLKNLRKAHIVYKDLEKAENLLKDLAHKK